MSSSKNDLKVTYADANATYTVRCECCEAEYVVKASATHLPIARWALACTPSIAGRKKLLERIRAAIGFYLTGTQVFDGNVASDSDDELEDVDTSSRSRRPVRF